MCSSCYNREHYAANRATYGKQNRGYYAKNRETVKARSARYRRLHPDKIKAMTARYTKDNAEEISARAKARYMQLRFEVIGAYGGKCVLCGEDRPEFLCIDHTNNNGKADRARHLFGGSLYAALKKVGYPKDDYRLLCFNCNMGRELTRRMSATVDNSQNRQTRTAKSEMIAAYGGRCACCDEDNPILLVLDHVNGGGQADRAQHGRGRVLYRYLCRLGWPQDGYRLLCHNCNMSIGFFGYCPHGGLE